MWLYFYLTYGEEKVSSLRILYHLVDHVSFRLRVDLPGELYNLQDEPFNLSLLVANASLEALYLLLLDCQLGVYSL